jgi:hypothetical protein
MARFEGEEKSEIEKSQKVGRVGKLVFKEGCQK